MKKIKLILTIALFALSFNAISQAKEIVYIRIQENIMGSGAPSSYMSIIYPDQSSKSIELTKIGSKGQAAEENGKKIQAEISQLINSGYEIISCSLGADYIASTTVMIFARQKEN